MGKKRKNEKGEPAVEPSTVRGRVKRHLRRLLIPGVIGLGACKANEPPSVVCDPMPAPVDAGAGGEPATDNTSVPPQTQKMDAAPPPVVCDPMPAPMPPPKDDKKKK